MLSEQQQRIMGYFIEEAKDHLNTIEQGLLNLQTTIADPEMVSEVFRAAHSVKGGAAMLGLSSIQHTSHRLEDYFKVLKECPVQVDQRLETLFLRIFDSLHELIDQLQGPFGLTEDKAEEVMAEVEPVFGELGQHLNLLVSQSGRALPEDVELVPAAAVSQKPLTTPQPAIAREESALQLIFQSDVPAQLREMLQLFKQADTDTSRQQLCSLCRVLAQAGEQLDLPNWCGLLGIVEQAIANGNNTYRALAPIVIKDVKHAQELVLVGQSSEISASEALLNLLPPVEQFAEEESITDTTDFADLLADARSTSSNDDALAAEFTIADVTDTEAEEAIDGDWLTLGFSQQGLSASDNPLNASSEGINFDLDADFGTEEEAFNFDALGLNEEELSAPLADAFDLRVDQFDEPAATASVNRTGPEVGVAELNSLADLFEGEVPDLGFTWEEEQVLHSSSDSFAESLAGDTSGDFSDLLFEPEASEELAFDEVEDDDLSGLLNSSAQWANYSARTPDRSEIGSNELSLADEFDSSFAASLESSPEAGSSQDDFENALFSSGPEPLEVDEESLFNSSSPETVTVNGFENLDDLLAGLEVDAIDSDLNAPTELSDLDQIFGSTLTESESLWEEADSATQDIDLLNLGLDTDLENTDLESIDLGNTGLESIDLESVNLENTDLENTALESMDLEPIEQDSSSEEEPFDWNAIDLTADLWEDSPATSVDSSDSSGLAPEGLEEDLTESFTLDSEVQPEAHQPELAAEDLIESFTLDSEVQPEPGLADFGEQDTFIQDEPQDDLFQNNLFENNLFQDELFQTADQDELFQTAEVIEDSELTADAEPLDSSLFDFSSEQTEAAPSSQTDEAGIDLAGMNLDISFENEFSASNFSDFELTSDSSPFEIAFNDSAFEEDASSMADFSQDSLAEDEQTAIEEPSTLLDLEWAEPSAEDNLIAMSLEDNIPEASDSTPEAVNFDPFLLADDELLEGSLTALESDEINDASNSEFADLEAMLGEDLELDIAAPEYHSGPTSSSVSPLDSTVEAIDTFANDDFADLEAMLGEDLTPPPPVTFATDNFATDDFADLEALLGDEELAVSSSTPQRQVAEFEVSPERTSLPAPSEDEFGDLEDLLKEADQKLGGSPTTRGARQASGAINRRTPRRNVLTDQTMRVSVKHLDNLNNLVGEMVVNRNSLEQAQERLRQFLDNLLYQVQQLSDVGQRMRDLYERSLLESSLLSNRRSYQISPQGGGFSTAQSNHATGASFDALEMDRFTGFHTLSQEMIELIVRVRESASDIDFVVEESDQVTRNFRQITTQLQEGLTRSRMVPFAQTADRLPRGVRDNSLKYGKQAELMIEGRDTLIDKMIVEQLYDPMTHLVNNAVAHGIETPAERVAAGKPPTGKIIIRAFHQGNQTVISVSDDGAGINPEKVKAKAVTRGLITAAEAKEMSRLDVYDLLFHHGFSTVDQVDDLRGRGVGLDVVRSNLNEIRGVISIDSAIGKGTTFTIRLPLTLSISKALCCISNRARIAFPMDGVEDMLDVPKERVQLDDQQRTCIYWRDILLPFQSLSNLLGYNRILGRGSVYGGNQEEDIISVVVLRSAGNFLALQVDQVLGEQEIVIKQLEGPVPKPVGVAGATVLGDGRIMPIADVLELIDLSQGRIRRESGNSLWDKSEEQIPSDGADAKTEPTVLIVDDSITVRELLSMTFNKVGYRVEQARDGQEAWEKLRSGLPCDLVFCDIEMPRMDGLELLSRIQKDPHLAHLPIAMLTSRGADRHRQMAVQLGAKGYFTKPYLEEMLLDAAQRMLKGEVLVTSNTQ